MAMSTQHFVAAIIIIYMRIMLRRKRQTLVNLFMRRKQESSIRRASARRRWKRRLTNIVDQRERSRAMIMMMTTVALDSSLRVERTMWVDHQTGNYWEETLNHPNCRPQRWIEDFRINKETFEYLCERLRPKLEKQNTKFREAVPYRKRVAVTLYRLATNQSHRETSRQFNVGRSTVCKIFYETCDAIVTTLLKEYINWPTGQRLQKVTDGFRRRNFPQCAGAIDGTHIEILAPEENHTDFLNRKNKHSMILQGVCDHKFRFIDINVGWPGRVHDARVFANSSIRTSGESGNLFPNLTENIEGVDIPVMIIGDPAYPLLNWLMKGFSDNGNLLAERALFNHMLSKARMVIEGTFGRLKGRWRCLLKRNDTDTDFLPTVITACCILHNMCEIHNQAFDPTWLQEVQHQIRDQMVAQQDYRDGNLRRVATTDAIREALVRHFAHNYPQKLAEFQ